jgi:hypothetical protein
MADTIGVPETIGALEEILDVLKACWPRPRKD